jgi:hypothetical protein
MDRATFRHWMLALAERHQRELTPGTISLYAAALAEMDSAEFAAACAALFTSGTYFPSPQEILDASPDRARVVAMAHRSFDNLYERVTGYWMPGTTPEQKTHNIEAGLGRAALVAFQATGGFDRWMAIFRGQDEKQKEWLRRDYLQALRHEQVTERAKALAESTTVQKLVTAQREGITGPARTRLLKEAEG